MAGQLCIHNGVTQNADWRLNPYAYTSFFGTLQSRHEIPVMHPPVLIAVEDALKSGVFAAPTLREPFFEELDQIFIRKFNTQASGPAFKKYPFRVFGRRQHFYGGSRQVFCKPYLHLLHGAGRVGFALAEIEGINISTLLSKDIFGDANAIDHISVRWLSMNLQKNNAGEKRSFFQKRRILRFKALQALERVDFPWLAAYPAEASP